MDKNLEIKKLGLDSRKNEQENFNCKNKFNNVMRENYLSGQETNGVELTTAPANSAKAQNSAVEQFTNYITNLNPREKVTFKIGYQFSMCDENGLIIQDKSMILPKFKQYEGECACQDFFADLKMVENAWGSIGAITEFYEHFDGLNAMVQLDIDLPSGKYIQYAFFACTKDSNENEKEA